MTGGYKKPPVRAAFSNLNCAVDCIYYVDNTNHRSAITAVSLKIDGTSGVNIHDQATGKSEFLLLFCVLNEGYCGICCCYKGF